MSIRIDFVETMLNLYYIGAYRRRNSEFPYYVDMPPHKVQLAAGCGWQ